MKTQIFLLACLGLLSSVTTQSTYCGRRLASALDFYCEGNLIKRSEPHDNNLELRWPWIVASKAHSLGYRRKRQVVDECCDKPCTIEELMTYCHF